jgi:chromosome segregation ATPase
MTTATKDDLHHAISTLGDELRSDLASKKDVADLRTELHATKVELKEDIRFLGARFENLESTVKAFGEGVVGMREHFTEEIRALRKELSSRIALLEEIVRKNSGDLQDVKADVADLRRRFDRLERENDLEKRVAEVEKRLGIR